MSVCTRTWTRTPETHILESDDGFCLTEASRVCATHSDTGRRCAAAPTAPSIRRGAEKPGRRGRAHVRRRGGA